MEETDFNFELFKGRGGKYNIAISISKPGILSFSSGMHHSYKLSQYKGINLFFDRLKNTIAIKFNTEEVEDMFTMKHRADNKGSFVACKSFITAYELDDYFGKKFNPKNIQHPQLGELTIISLDELS